MTDTLPASALPTAAPTLAPAASGKSIAALVLGVLGLLACQLLSPIAWYLGWSELRDIRAGLAPPSGQDYATIGMVLGIVGSALIGVVLLAIAFAVIVVIAALSIAGIVAH